MNKNGTDKFIFEGDQPVRLDLFLVSKLPQHSRSIIQASIETGHVTVDGLVRKSKYKVKKGELVQYLVVDKEIDIEDIPAENIPLNIIFENDDVIVINKQANLSSHPTPNQRNATLVNALLYYYKGIESAVYDPDNNKSRIRAGIVHRLDKDTTGAMIIAKNAAALRTLSSQIKLRQVDKNYVGLCMGNFDEDAGELINYLGRDNTNRKRFTEVGDNRGKKAITKYQILNSFQFGNHELSLVNFNIVTGRTHQIRSQMLLCGHPIIGDPIYFTDSSSSISKELGAKRQMLHSQHLSIILPHNDKPSRFEAELPGDFSNILSKISK